MSKYTTEVRYICEYEAGLTESVGLNSVDDVIEAAVSKIFDFDFPIFSEDYRETLEKKILKYFYVREIGFETVALWKLHLCNKLNEIMPYYNKLYESELKSFDPFLTKNMTTASTKTGDSQTAGVNNTKNDDEDWNLYSDTPQGGLEGVEDLEYLTTARKQTSDRESTSNYQSLNTNNDTENTNVSGYDMRSGSSLLKEWRETFLNIDAMILRDLDILFMQVW